MEETVNILKKKSLSVTDARRAILNLFITSNGSLAHADIENNKSISFDRVTVYRTLQTFAEKCIIHQIPTTDNTIQYAMCKDDCEDGNHHDEHVHFICDNCTKTICLDEVTVPSVQLPKGFRVTNSAMIVNGMCDECN